MNELSNMNTGRKVVLTVMLPFLYMVFASVVAIDLKEGYRAIQWVALESKLAWLLFLGLYTTFLWFMWGREVEYEKEEEDEEEEVVEYRNKKAELRHLLQNAQRERQVRRRRRKSRNKLQI